MSETKTLRDEFAMFALTMIGHGLTKEAAAKDAYAYADAMLTERKRLREASPVVTRETLTTELQSYYDRLDRLDWHYDKSESRAAYTAGKDAQEVMLNEASGRREWVALFCAMEAHHRAGAPKPQRP